MSVHARPVRAEYAAAVQRVLSVLDVTRRLFVLAAIFGFVLALTAIALDGVSLRTVNLQYSHPVTTPAPATTEARD